jgi:hypothetical protein
MRKTKSAIQISFDSVCLASFSTAMFGPNYELRGIRAGWTAFPQSSQRLPLNSSSETPGLQSAATQQCPVGQPVPIAPARRYVTLDSVESIAERQERLRLGVG